jgi:hypothetical protein
MAGQATKVDVLGEGEAEAGEAWADAAAAGCPTKKRCMPTRVIIVKAEMGYRVTDDDGVSMRIPEEGKKDIGAINGTLFDTTAKWQDGTLRVERKFKVGLKVTDEYAVAGDPRVLTVTSTIEGLRGRGGPPPTVKRVYNLEPL